MKKVLLTLSLMATSAMVMANPIVGTWQTYENGEAKAQVKITQSGETFSGKIVAGNTEKAKKYVGKQVLHSLKSTGGTQYQGKAQDPRWGFSVNAKISVNGDSLKISTLKGSQNWKKIN